MSLVNIDNNEFDTGNFKVQVGPNRRIDPSNGYVFFMCEPKEGDKTTFLAILKTKKGDLVYPSGNEHNTDLINSLMIKTNEILDSTEAIYKRDLAPETLNNEVVTFVNQDLDPTNDENTVMNFDLGGALSSIGDAIGNTVKSGVEAVKKEAEEIVKAGEKVGKTIVQVGNIAVDIGKVCADPEKFHQHMNELDEHIKGK
ncbi:hypothetical protein PQ796_01535 (plasmid) [Priestia megaterium]|uniref:hypothetical protein n=1 Tax=Priestia megaterium TaxID=1404 RepID=UPI00244C8CF2|nr:hypothetical protein [Priestia megaterium]MDH2449280.1 hypothetical protein [Priestia megaterium]MDL5148738.1 hypothetical protein [Priestia megaterium]